MVNAYKKENHEEILKRWPGSNDIYRDNISAVKAMVAKKNRVMDDTDYYRLLLWSVSVQKQMDCHNNETINPEFTPEEGNHRLAAHTLISLESGYDPKTGQLECGTLRIQWLIEQLCAKKPNEKDTIIANLENCNLHAWIRKTLNGEDSPINSENVRMLINYGVTKEKFETKNRHEHCEANGHQLQC